jgi:hypothetical protein
MQFLGFPGKEPIKILFPPPKREFAVTFEGRRFIDSKCGI